jgi:hypothetical protein
MGINIRCYETTGSPFCKQWQSTVHHWGVISPGNSRKRRPHKKFLYDLLSLPDMTELHLMTHRQRHTGGRYPKWCTRLAWNRYVLNSVMNYPKDYFRSCHFRWSRSEMQPFINSRIPETDQTLLTQACLQENEEVARVLIAEGADVQLQGRINYQTGGSGMMTPLACAASRGNLALVIFLHESCGAPIDTPMGSQGTALHYASMQGHTNVADYLLKKGANIEAIGDHHVTALMTACLALRNPARTYDHYENTDQGRCHYTQGPQWIYPAGSSRVDRKAADCTHTVEAPRDPNYRYDPDIQATLCPIYHPSTIHHGSNVEDQIQKHDAAQPNYGTYA